MVGERTGDSEMDREEGDEIAGARARAWLCVCALPVRVFVGGDERVGAYARTHVCCGETRVHAC